MCSISAKFTITWKLVGAALGSTNGRPRRESPPSARAHKAPRCARAGPRFLLHAGPAPRVGHHEGQPILFELHVALTLLLEADADTMADELMRERARHAGDREPEHDLLERRGVAGLEALADELAHALVADLLGPDLFQTSIGESDE